MVQCREALAVDALHQKPAIYTVEGLIYYEPIALGTNLQEVYQFRAAVSNCVWAITTKKAVPGGPVYKQVHDGQFTSASTLFDPEELERILADAKNSGISRGAKFQQQEPRNDSELIVEARSTPIVGTQPMVSQVWLAFASQCYLGDSEEGSVDLVWFVDPLLNRSQFKTYAKWRRHGDSPHLPEQITYYFDKEQFSGALNGAHYESAAAPAANAPVWVTYLVNEFTNAQLSIPQSFLFSGYESLSGPSRLVYTYKGELTNWFLGVDQEALERGLGKKTVVMDSRSVDPKLVSRETPTPEYFVTNGTLPSLEDRVVQRAVAHARIAELAASRGDRKTTWPYWLAMLAPAPFLLAYMLKGRKRDRMSINNKTNRKSNESVSKTRK